MTTPRVTVPVAPTEAMMKAADAVDWNNEDERASVINMWQAMLSAAPAPEDGAVFLCDHCNGDGYIYPNGIGDGHNHQDVCPSCGGAGGFDPNAPALATREEAPAEAEEDFTPVTGLWKDQSLSRLERVKAHRMEFRSDVSQAVKAVDEEASRQSLSALRAQPPAREDAQPFGYWVEHRSGENPVLIRYGSFVPASDHYKITALYTHPAPDALRVAVEALEKIERWHGEFPETGEFWLNDDKTPSERPISYGSAYGSNGERDFMRSVARQALAALQAEQGEK